MSKTEMTRIHRRTLLSAGAVALAAPALIGHARAATTLKMSTSYPNDPKFSTARIWYDLFLPKLKAATDGQVAISFFPDNQLGQEADVITEVEAGVVDAMLAGSSIWSDLVPEFGVFDMGYVFQDYDHLLRPTATPAGAGLQKLLVEKAGAHLPAWGRNVGARNFLTTFAFSDPAGLAGRKIRCLPTPNVTATVSLMGAEATPMAFGEVYTALQAGVISGLEHDAPTILAAKFDEVAKHFTLTRHILTPFGCFVSDRTLKRIKPDQRDGLLKAIREATVEWDRRAGKVEDEAVDELKKQGVTVANCDRNAFRDRVRPLCGRFVQKTPGAKPMLDAALATEKA